MVPITHLILLVCTATALVLPRDASQIQANLKTLNSDYIALKQADEAYANGGSAASIQTAVETVETDTKKITTDAKASNTLSQSDSQAIIEYVSNTLEPSIKPAIQATVANKELVEKAGLMGAVQGMCYGAREHRGVIDLVEHRRY